MTKKPVELVTDKPRHGVIEYIEQLLAKAKSGEIQSIAVAMRFSHCGTGSGWSGLYTDDLTLLGEIALLQRDVTDTLSILRVDPKTGSVDEQ